MVLSHSGAYSVTGPWRRFAVAISKLSFRQKIWFSAESTPLCGGWLVQYSQRMDCKGRCFLRSEAHRKFHISNYTWKPRKELCTKKNPGSFFHNYTMATRQALMFSKNSVGTEQATERSRVRQPMNLDCDSSANPAGAQGAAVAAGGARKITCACHATALLRMAERIDIG